MVGLLEYVDVMETPASRIQHLMGEDQLNQIELAQKTGKSKGLVSSYLNPANKISDIFLRTVEDELGWSSRWIRTGEGPERVSKKIGSTYSKNKREEVVALRFIDETDVTITPSGAEFRDLDNGMVMMTISLVDQYAYASYPQGWNDPEYIEDLPKHSIVLPKRDRGFYRSFEVRGDSMDQAGRWAILDGDTVTGRKVEPNDWSNKIYIKEGIDYIINHREGLIIKRIASHNIKDGRILCVSTNEDKEKYPDFELPLNEVNELYEVVKVDRKWKPY